jgi:ferric-dicitrate binding protein FerR (iron transport regulator)
LAELDDDLVDRLLAYRDAVTDRAPEPSAERSRRLWARIEAEMEEAPSTSRPDRAPDRAPRRPEGTGMRRVWVGVFALLLLAAVAWLVWPTGGPDLVARADAERAIYRTDAGDVVRLRPHSRLYRVDGDDGPLRVEGEAVFEVVPRAQGAFVVQADGVEIRVLGTRFTVQTWTPRPTVFLEEGRLEVRSASTGRAATLAPNRAATLGEDGSVVVRDARPSAYLDWLDGTVAFTSESARSVADELEHHYDVRVRLPDSVARQTLSGELVLDREEQTLRDFGAVLGGRFRQQNGAYVFSDR